MDKAEKRKAVDSLIVTIRQLKAKLLNRLENEDYESAAALRLKVEELQTELISVLKQTCH